MTMKRAQDQSLDNEHPWKRPNMDIGIFGNTCKLLLTEAEASAVNGWNGSWLAEIQQATLTQLKLSGSGLPYPGTVLQELQICGDTEADVFGACTQVLTKIASIGGSLSSVRIKVILPTKMAKAILSNQGAIVKQLREETHVHMHVENQVIPVGPVVASSEQVLSMDGSFSALQSCLQRVLQQVALMSSEPWYTTWASVSNCGTLPPELPLFSDHTTEAKERYMRTKAERKALQTPLDAGLHVVKLLVYDFEGSAVLGAGGARIREMSAASGTKMMLSHRNEFYPGTQLQELRIWGKTEETTLDGAMYALRHIATAGKPKEEADAIWASSEGGPGPQMEVRMKLVVPLQAVKRLTEHSGAVAKELQDKSSLTLRYGEEGVAAHAVLVEQVLNLNGPLAGARVALNLISSIFTSFLSEPWFVDWVGQSLCMKAGTTNKDPQHVLTPTPLHQTGGENFALAKAMDMAAIAVGQGPPLSTLAHQGINLGSQTQVSQLDSMAFAAQAVQNMALVEQAAKAAQAKAAEAVEAAQALQAAQLAQATLQGIMAIPPVSPVGHGLTIPTTAPSPTIPTFGMPPMFCPLTMTAPNILAPAANTIANCMSDVATTPVAKATNIGKVGIGKGRESMTKDIMALMLQKKSENGKGFSEKGKKEMEIQADLIMEMEMKMEKELLAEMEALGKGCQAKALLGKGCGGVADVLPSINGVAPSIAGTAPNHNIVQNGILEMPVPVPAPPPLPSMSSMSLPEGARQTQPQPVFAELPSARGVPMGIKFLVDAGELQSIKRQDPDLVMLQLKTKSRIVVSDEAFPGCVGLQEVRILGESAKAVLVAMTLVLTKITEIAGKLCCGGPGVEFGHARIKMLVPARAAAAVIGPGGHNVKELNQHCGVKTHVDMTSIPCTRDMAEQAICLAGSMAAVCQALPTILGHVATFAAERWFKGWIITSNAGKSMPGLTLWASKGKGKHDNDTLGTGCAAETLVTLALPAPPPPPLPVAPELPLVGSATALAVPAPPPALVAPDVGMSPPKIDDNVLMQVLAQQQDLLASMKDGVVPNCP